MTTGDYWFTYVYQKRSSGADTSCRTGTPRRGGPQRLSGAAARSAPPAPSGEAHRHQTRRPCGSCQLGYLANRGHRVDRRRLELATDL
jgi:hypothetical protein